MPASASIAIVIGHASHGRVAPMPVERRDVVAEAASRARARRSPRTPRGSSRGRRRGRRPSPAAPSREATTTPREHVAGLRDRRVREQALERGLAERADVADDDRDRGERGERRAPSRAAASISATSKSRSSDAERGGLRRDRHERGDRRRRALVDVGRPLVERRDRRLEARGRRASARCRSSSSGSVDEVRRRRSPSAIPAKSVEPVAP